MTKTDLKIVKPGDAEAGNLADVKGASCFLMLPDREKSPRDRSISKIGGLPYLSKAMGWPNCLSCGDPLAFIGQFLHPRLHEALQGPMRILSFFYCFSCAPFWDVLGKGFFLGRIDMEEGAELLPIKKTPVLKHPDIRPVALRFSESTDYPDLQDRPGAKDVTAPVRELLLEQTPTVAGSKLGGFPAWLQRPDAPRCRFCGGTMHFLGQIDGGDFPGLVFADQGRVFMFECTKGCGGGSLSIVVQGE